MCQTRLARLQQGLEGKRVSDTFRLFETSVGPHLRHVASIMRGLSFGMLGQAKPA